MKFQARYNSTDLRKETDLLGKLLTNRGVEDVDSFLNLDDSCIHDGMLMKNMKEAIECLDKYVQKAKKQIVKVCIIVD